MDGGEEKREASAVGEIWHLGVRRKMKESETATGFFVEGGRSLCAVRSFCFGRPRKVAGRSGPVEQ